MILSRERERATLCRWLHHVALREKQRIDLGRYFESLESFIFFASDEGIPYLQRYHHRSTHRVLLPPPPPNFRETSEISLVTKRRIG